MMKKKLLARSIVLGLLCAGVWNGVVFAENTMSITDADSQDITVYTGGYESSTSGTKIVNIHVSRNQDLTINPNTVGSNYIAIMGNNVTGLYHDSTAETKVYSRNLLIRSSGGYTGSKSIDNQRGVLTFIDNVFVEETINNSSAGVLNFDGTLYLDVCRDDSSDPNVGIINRGTLNVNGKLDAGVYDDSLNGNNSFYSDYTSMHAIDNYDTLNANVYWIHGDVMHDSAATTVLNLQSNGADRNGPFGIDWGVFQGNVINSNSNFNLKINDGSVWLPRNQTGEVEGITLNGGWVSLSIDNYVWNESVPSGDFWSHAWNDSYDTLVLKNVKIENTSFSASRNINDFVSTSGGFSLSTDLANNQGDKFVFTGTPEIAPNVDKIGLFIWDKNATPQNMISEDQGKKVTIIEAPESSNMKFDATLGFNRNYESFRVYDPIIREETDGTTHKWNFVGWQASEKSPSGESKQIWEDPYINVIDLDNTLKRINDIRTDPSEVGVWLRGESGKMKIRSYSYDYNIMSGGYDWDFDSNAAKMFLGFGISHAKNDCDTGIIGNTKSMGYNLYGSWLGKENKDYVDVIVKYGTLDKDYAGLDDNNVFVKGDYDKNLFSIAAKYGRRIEREDGWYWEPSVGLTWGRISSADYTDSQGIKIHADSSTSKMASLGVQVGKNIKGTEYYGKFEVRHDFDGKMHVSVPDSTLPGSNVYDDMGGTWYKVGIGAARKIDKNNSFYIDIEKDFGNKVKKPYSIGAGYRYTW